MTQLKDELRRRKAKVSGNKATLVERLESYQRNHNFGADEKLDDEPYEMETPAPSQYRDINRDSPVPVLTEETVAAYMKLHDQKLRSNVLDMYAERFLKSIRMAQNDGLTFQERG